MSGNTNDWFDPVFIQKRIELIKKHNKIESEEGTIRGNEDAS